MKRKMSKKVLCLCMVAVLAIGLAIPTFAAGNPNIINGSHYNIYPNAQTSYLLNVYGNGNSGDNVTIYRPTGGNDQSWRMLSNVNSSTKVQGYYAICALSNTMALNINHSNGNCNLHTYAGNATDGKSDAAVVVNTSNRTIRLRDWPNEFLCFAGVSNDANVYWAQTQMAWTWAAK